MANLHYRLAESRARSEQTRWSVACVERSFVLDLLFLFYQEKRKRIKLKSKKYSLTGSNLFSFPENVLYLIVRKKINIILLAVFAITNCYAQNLMLNGNLENHLGDSPLITNAPPWDGWGSPDYLNTSGTAMNGSAPSNQWGTQAPQSGNGYSGFLCYSTYPSFPSIQNAREFLYGKTSSPLQNGKQYCLTFYISLSDTFNYALNRIGAYFSVSPTNPIIGSPPYLVFYQPQVMADSTIFYDDKVNWKKIEGAYTSTGGEQYITFGNLYLDNRTDTLRLGPHFPPYTTARETFYYFDNFSLEEIKPADAGPPSVSILPGDSIQIGNDLDSGSVYTWTPGYFINDTNAIRPFVKPPVTTTYYVQKKQCSVTTIDSITVHVSSAGTNDLENPAEIRVYPNPGSENISISIKGSIAFPLHLSLFDPIGKVVKQIQNITSSSFELERSSLDTGIYIYSLTDKNNKQIGKGKIVFVN